MIRHKAKRCSRCLGKGIVRVWDSDSLKKTRQKTGKSMRSVARQLGISGAYLSDIENGNRPVPEAVAKAYMKLK